jgi:hypothetical protein
MKLNQRRASKLLQKVYLLIILELSRNLLISGKDVKKGGKAQKEEVVEEKIEAVEAKPEEHVMKEIKEFLIHSKKDRLIILNPKPTILPRMRTEEEKLEIEKTLQQKFEVEFFIHDLFI